MGKIQKFPCEKRSHPVKLTEDDLELRILHTDFAFEQLKVEETIALIAKYACEYSDDAVATWLGVNTVWAKLIIESGTRNFRSAFLNEHQQVYRPLARKLEKGFASEASLAKLIKNWCCDEPIDDPDTLLDAGNDAPVSI